MSGGTAIKPSDATDSTYPMSHRFTTSQCRPLDRIVIWLSVSSTLRLDDQINVAVEDVQEIEYVVH
jgi:hypothetical protein